MTTERDRRRLSTKPYQVEQCPLTAKQVECALPDCAGCPVKLNAEIERGVKEVFDLYSPSACHQRNILGTR